MRKPDTFLLPDGLHVRSGFHASFGNVREIVDAQDHVWITLHPGASGDPKIWSETIARLVALALDAEHTT